MMNIVYHIVQGLIVVLISMGILHWIRKMVPDHNLPKKNSSSWVLCTFLGGFVLCFEDWMANALLVVCIAYLAAMAYTDFYTMQVYSFFYLIVAVIGYFRLIIIEDWTMIFSVVIFAIIVLMGKKTHAYAGGDVEVYLAVAPYMTVLAERNCLDVFLLLWLHFCFSLLLAGIGEWFRKKCGQISKRQFAFVPAIYAAFIGVLIFENLI